MNTNEYTKEQADELSRIDRHINALEIAYNNCIKLLTKPISLMDTTEDDEAKPEGGEKPEPSAEETHPELLALKLGQLKRYYAQGIDELAKVADNVYEKISSKRLEREKLVAKFKGVELETEQQEPEQQSKRSATAQRLK